MGTFRALYAGFKLNTRQKFTLFIILLGCVFAFNFGYEFYTISRISNLSKSISGEALALTKGVEAAFRTMLGGRFAFGELLRSDDGTTRHPDELSKLEADFRRSIVAFDAYIAAVKWGSESESFKKSDGGLNYLEWKRLGLEESLVIAPPPERGRQLAAIADMYWSGFAVNAFKAIGEHKRALRLEAGHELESAALARVSAQKHFERASHFFNLSLETLNAMVDEANTSAAHALSSINTLQQRARVNAILIFGFGFLVSLLIVWFYTQSMGTALAELAQASKMLVRRDLELSRSHERLLELDELKSQFVSTAAHQLRTPLTGIRWSLNELVEGDFGELTPEQKSIVKETGNTNTRLINLVNDLLDMARLDEGRAEFDMKDIDLAPTIARAHEQFKKLAASKGVVFNLEVSATLPKTFADSEKIFIALTNLIDNAIKYTPPGGTVTVHARVDGGAISVSVSDTGIGVPENQRSRLFSRFFRAHNAMLMETYGSGLGLAVVKGIMDKHGGIASQTNRQGGGSTFTLTLPIRKTASENAVV